MITIKEEHTWVPGSGAAIKDFELQKAPIAAIIIRQVALNETDATTLTEDLTQFATLMYIKDGGTRITPEWSATEFYQYHSAFFGRVPPSFIGTKANNTMNFIRMVMPLGRPQVMSHASFLPSIVDPLVGLNPKGTPYLVLSVPADAANDNREYKIAVVYKHRPFRYTKRWTDWASQTLSTTSYKSWVIGDKGLWLELFGFQTTEEHTHPASDVPTILTVNAERGGKDVLFDGDVTNPLTALQPQHVGLVTHGLLDDQYMYMTLSQAPFDNFDMCVRLSQETKFRVKGGAADAAKFAFSVLTK